MKVKVRVQWTATAVGLLRKLPAKVRRGLLSKGDELAAGGDPRKRYKALAGPLKGYYRIPFGRYRAIYTVEEEKRAGRVKLLHLKVVFIAAGIRKERDRKDIYRLAEKIVKLTLDEDPAG